MREGLLGRCGETCEARILQGAHGPTARAPTRGQQEQSSLWSPKFTLQACHDPTKQRPAEALDARTGARGSPVSLEHGMVLAWSGPLA